MDIKNLAETLNAINYGRIATCPCCDRMFDTFHLNPSETDDNYYCPNCKDEQLETMTINDYFANTEIYDIEYRVTSKHDDIKSVSVCIAWGGPSVYIDTGDNKIKLYWWMDYSEHPIDSNTGDTITEYFNDLWLSNCE